jgi:site-specific DNA-methyltransferase (adenine-specific)
MTTIDQVLSGEARWALVEGDCLEIMATMPDGCVDHVITDPPYSDWTHSKNRGNPLAGRSPLKDIEFCAITPEERRTIATDAARLAVRWSMFWTDLEGISCWVDAILAAELEYVRTGVWSKIGCAPQMSGDRPGTGAEALVIAHPKKRKRWNGGGRAALWHRPIAALEGQKDHTTQKPLSLMLDLVRDFTDPDDLILDPFAGSGTTGVAALKLGRRAILIEKDPKYAEIARQRMLDTEEELAAEAGEIRQYTKPRQAGLFTTNRKDNS